MHLLPLLLSALAHAAEPALRMDVDADAPLDVPAIAQALSSELDTTVLLEGEAPARVTVRAQGPGTIAIVYEGDDGARRERVVELPAETAESTRVVVLLVSNLARDQVGRLALPAVNEVGPATDTAETTDPAADEHAAGVAASPASPTGDTPSAPVPAQTAHADTREPAERRFLLGAVVVGGAAGVDDVVTPLVGWGLEFGARVTPHLRLGVARIAVAAGGSFPDDGTTFLHVNGTPYAELSTTLGARVEPYGRAGVLLRGTDEGESPLEIAPYLGGGARFYASRLVAIGLEVGANLVVSDELTLAARPLPRWSVPGTVGLSTTFHF